MLTIAVIATFIPGLPLYFSMCFRLKFVGLNYVLLNDDPDAIKWLGLVLPDVNSSADLRQDHDADELIL